MSNGWVEIIWDGKPALVRVCWVRAWDDPAWRKANGLPEEQLRHDGRRRRVAKRPVE